MKSSATFASILVRDRVWWSDVDQMGIMYFGRYIRFAERAETELFRSIGYSHNEIHAAFAIWLARVHVELDFRSPARLDDELVCAATVVRCGGASIDLRFAIEHEREQRRIADIRFTIACIDAEKFRSTRIPPALRSALEMGIEA